MFKQLTIRDRVILQFELDHSQHISCAQLALLIGCHPSTLYRELKRNTHVYTCRNEAFMHQAPLQCPRLAKFPFTCNACLKFGHCPMRRRLYDAYEADRTARHTLRSSRTHPSLDAHQMKALDAQVSLRIQAHQSLYHIYASDPSIPVSQGTLRRYIDRRYLSCQNIDLPRTVRFPYQNPVKRPQRKRITIDLLVNRTYLDFIDYTRSRQRIVLQLDTMIGKTSDKKALLTLYEPLTKFQWGVLVYRGSSAVNEVVAKLIAELSAQGHLFFDCILTDNGAEFQSLPLLELNEEGRSLCRVFFCDPYASYQKGGCERNHSLVRYVIKKGESFDLATQAEIDLLFSHINSQRRKSLRGKSPFQAFIERFRFSPSTFVNVFEVDSKHIHLK